MFSSAWILLLYIIKDGCNQSCLSWLMNAEDWHRQSSEWPNSLSLCDLKKNILETNELGNHPGSPSLWYIRNFFWRWHLFIVHIFKRSWSLLSNEMKPQCIIKLFQQVWRKIPNCMISVLKINLCIDIKLVFFFPLHWLCCIKVDEMRYSVD